MDKQDSNFGYARYSDLLVEVLNALKVKQLLRKEYEDDYSGYVDVDALLEDGRVFSYKYWYGSCSVCDEWEDRELSGDEIKDEMMLEATIFDSLGEYEKWRKMTDETPRGGDSRKAEREET